MPLMKRPNLKKLKKNEAVIEEVKARTAKSTRKHKYHDWDVVRERYVSARPQLTYAEVAQEFGIGVQTLSNRAAKEKWKHQRANEQLKIAKDLRREYSITAATKGIKFDEVAGDTATMGMSIVTARLLEISRMVAARGNTMDEVVNLMRAGLPVPKEMTYFAVSYRELVGLAQAAQIFQDVGRKALGTDITQLEAHITHDVEVSGSVEQVVSIGGELQKDNPERLADFLEVLSRMGMMTPEGEVVDGELVDDEMNEMEDNIVKEIEAKAEEK